MIAVTGWNNSIYASGYSEFNGSRSSLDLNGFDRFYVIPAAIGENQMETKLWLSVLSRYPDDPIKVLFSARDTAGNEDISDIIISQIDGALVINETSVAPQVISKGSRLVSTTQFDMSAVGESITVESMNLTLTGTAEGADIDGLRVYQDSNGNEVFDGNDYEIIDVRGGLGKEVNIPMDITISKDGSESFFAVLDVSADALEGGTIGIRILEPGDVVFGPGVVTLTPLYLTNSYIDSVGDNIIIDGAFSDWEGRTIRTDSTGDVRLGNEAVESANIDILDYGVGHDTESLSVYMDVVGTMLGGVTVPWNATRPKDIKKPIVALDSDGDGILDRYEPGYEHDFDNDVGLPDDPGNPIRPNTGPDGFDHDSDNDMIEDFPWGNDTWLWRPETNKTRYIGPHPPIPKLPVVTGEDMAYVFIDTDCDSFTGYYVNEFLGADFMVNISGKGNVITSKYLNMHNNSNGRGWVWDFISDVDVAVDSRALEAQFDFDILGIAQNQTFNVWFMTTDWRDCSDLSDNGINGTRESRGTRAKPGAKVVLNEIFPDTNGWVELYNKGKQATDISGWEIAWDGNSYTIPQGTTIQAGGFLAFDVGSIPDSGTVTLYDDKGKQEDTTTFTSVPSGEGWGRYPDGEDNWIYTNPTKAAANEPASPPPPVNVVINEVYPDTNGWVELFNTDTQGGPTDISGWNIVWSGGTYTIPQNTKIQKQSFLAFDIGNIPASDTVTLYNDADVEQDSVTFSNVPSGYGWGRYPDGSGSWWITIPTKAASNTIPEFTDAVIPLLFMVLMFGFVRYRKDKKGNGKKEEKKKMRRMNDKKNVMDKNSADKIENHLVKLMNH
jgi:hypothetical protein